MAKEKGTGDRTSELAYAISRVHPGRDNGDNWAQAEREIEHSQNVRKGGFKPKAQGIFTVAPKK